MAADFDFGVGPKPSNESALEQLYPTGRTSDDDLPPENQRADQKHSGRSGQKDLTVPGVNQKHTDGIKDAQAAQASQDRVSRTRDHVRVARDRKCGERIHGARAGWHSGCHGAEHKVTGVTRRIPGPKQGSK